ncbi:hypothetical protein [Caulobacter sp. 1776]|uniref:hypothetical protein n=1 Tax=Caulobacter sp. 1776 TaxID=3156420 RepID=UPI00339AC77D
MSKSHPDARPTWFRLSEASWADIAAEYKNGATAAELSAKWKVSTRSIYNRAGKDGWTKKAHGDAVARAHADAQTEAETAARFRQPTPLPGEIWLIDDESVEAFNAAPLSTDPSDLRDAAMARLAAAIHQGRDHEALRLTTLADRLARLTAPEPPTAEPAAHGDGHDAERARLLMSGFVDWRPTRAAVEHETELMFRSVYLLALAMLLKPENVPSLFKRRAMRFRRDYLGEDDAEALAGAERATERVLKELDVTFMDFNGPEPRPARKLPARTWPPPRPPYPSRKRLAELASPPPEGLARR